MVLINGNYKFIVYKLDTQKSIMNRLAYELKTLPNYLYFPSGIPTLVDFHNNEGKIVVEDLLKTLSSSSKDNFVGNLEEIKVKLSQQKLNMVLDILPLYIAYNKVLVDIPKDFQEVYSLTYQEELNKSGLFEKPENIYKIWEERENIKTTFDKQIKSNAVNVKKDMDLYEQFYSIKKGVLYTEFELERVSFEFVLNMSNIYIIEIFNQVQLNPYVPFACINNTFKILKDFIPPKEWSVNLNSAIVFKVLQKVELQDHKESDFVDAILSSSTIEGEISVGMSLHTTIGKNITREKLIERLFDSIKGVGKIMIKSIKENKVNGVFLIPQHSMNKYVFADLVMNNLIFSSLLKIDESEKASKRKDSVYIYFKHPLIGDVMANITQKKVEKGDYSSIRKNMKDDFIVGETYIRVKITSANNIEAVIDFQDILSKLFVIYDKEYQNIVDFYTKYIPKFIQDNYIQKPMIINNLKLKDIAPEVFLKGYPPKCPSQPSIIDDDQVKEAKAAGKMVMTYPQTKDEGFLMRNYICNHKTAIYPGLRNNPLHNRDIVPYLPCCYTKSHEDKKGSIYRHYYYEEELKSKSHIEQQDFIITNKFVSKDKYGILPDDITKLFEVFDQQNGYMYVRKGVENNKSSFLNCVMEGMHNETNILNYQDKEREAVLYKTREKMATLEYAASCRQEMYDFTIAEIISSIKNPNINLEPNLFVSLLESYFDCNIFVFNRTNNRNGQLALPRHLQSYYKTKRKSKSIFIYEHNGSTSDHSDYKRCELIVRWKIGGGSENDVTYFSLYDSNISKGVQSVFNAMHNSYALNLKIPETEFPINNKKIKLIGQGIDSYGKSRMIKLIYKEEIATLLTTPIQPLVIPEIEKWIPTKLKQKTAINLCQELNIILTGQSISRDVVKELYGILGNVRISIPIEDGTPDTDIPLVSKGSSYIESNTSIIDNHNKYKKLTRYIIEYMFWLFSRYIHEQQIKAEELENEQELNVIKSFIKTNVKINKDFEYSNVEKSFNLKSGVMNNGQLIIKSKETLKRLVYTLRLSLLRFRQKIIDYHTRKVIENYYLDVSDFDQHQFQVILQGDNSVEKWIQQQKTKYFLYDSAQPQLITTYFFKNTLVDDKIYLAQNTDDIGKAMDIYNIWKKSKYNPNYEDVRAKGNDPIRILTFTLFRYINSTDIKKYKINGLSTEYDIKILGYKIEEKAFYTVLLDL